jgi:hypothetical protein
MLYNLSLMLDGFHLLAAALLTVAFLLTSIVKEKRDERKRA